MSDEVDMITVIPGFKKKKRYRLRVYRFINLNL
jgi:hypothetical protein